MRPSHKNPRAWDKKMRASREKIRPSHEKMRPAFSAKQLVLLKKLPSDIQLVLQSVIPVQVVQEVQVVQHIFRFYLSRAMADQSNRRVAHTSGRPSP